MGRSGGGKLTEVAEWAGFGLRWTVVERVFEVGTQEMGLGRTGFCRAFFKSCGGDVTRLKLVRRGLN